VVADERRVPGAAAEKAAGNQRRVIDRAGGSMVVVT